MPHSGKAGRDWTRHSNRARFGPHGSSVRLWTAAQILAGVALWFTLPAYEPCPERWIGCFSIVPEQRIVTVELWGCPMGPWPAGPRAAFQCLEAWPVAGLSGTLQRTATIPDGRLWCLWTVTIANNGMESPRPSNMIVVQPEGYVAP